MEHVFVILLTIVSIIVTASLIRSAFRLGTRIAVASEASQFLLQAIYDALPEEQKVQARQVVELRKQNAKR
jgi:hypothetical protein